MLLKPNIPGIELSNTFSAIEILHNPDKCGAEAVIIGGGLIGLETALFLSERGKKVTVIEMLKAVGVDMGSQTRREIRERLGKAGIVLETNTQVVSIEENGVNAVREEQMLEYPADTIVFATGLVPNNLLTEQMPEGLWEYYCIGDCVSPQKILEAVRDGYQLALSL
jgi:pyruvate/2-oxoglutarate dehydrogenase complex dihydrolipoamide dehydrogenase (E3) component